MLLDDPGEYVDRAHPVRVGQAGVDGDPEAADAVRHGRGPEAADPDPGREAGDGAPLTRIRVDSNSVPMWLVSTYDGASRATSALDRAVLATQRAVFPANGLGGLLDL